MKWKTILGLLIAAMLTLLSLSQAGATPLDLSTFTAEEGAVVTSGGGLTFTESDSSLADFYVFDPAFFVDPTAITLTFDYSFTVGPENDDYLVVFIDFLNNVFLVGEYNASPNTPAVHSGSASVDLRPYQGGTIDLAFGFEASDNLFDSFGAFSNLAITLSDPVTPVPEPATLLLLGLGLLGLAKLKRERHS